ncbi:MAG TPA: replication-associated recombination protein A [Candidatus Dormibacteraeota bacterium]|nr:replication-associated recombination protein A [Candidatus Dormibacteraeota bacterium]
MRPASLDEFVGQRHAVGPGTVLRRALEDDTLPSLILWGPPGSGKTTLARIVAERTGAGFEAVSAVGSGVADLRAAAARADERRRLGRRTVLFVDEIHRFSKAQQDAILPHVESGLVRLLGATTENPSFEVNSALLSRARVVRLEPLTVDDLGVLVDRALGDVDRGLGGARAELDADARDRLLTLSGGDARVALDALEVAVAATAPSDDGIRRVPAAAVEGALQSPALRFDRAGDEHYAVISALIKSVRGSDPDAAVYWLARLLEAGEDPMFVARRLVLLAAEDVGLADPQALGVAMAAHAAAHAIGMPEGFLPLSEATLYLALAPKSNSALRAYSAAAADVAETLTQPVPLHLRNAVTRLDRTMGAGRGYRYAHDFPEGVAEQQHLPDALAGRRYYDPGTRGVEPDLWASLQRRRGVREGEA